MKNLYVGLLVILTTSVLLGGCLEKEAPQLKKGTETPAASPINIELSLSKPPSKGETAELLANVTSVRDAPNTTIQINLPEGFALVEGKLSWKGNIAKNEEIQLTPTIKAVGNGNWTIKAFAKKIISEDSWWMDKDNIYISIKDGKGKIRKSPFPTSNNTTQTKIE